jgi:DNA mismatch repair protein MutS
MRSSKATPMIQQYLSIKEKYPDEILFYRMGDFYEMFFEDAEIASRILEITLTSRNKNDQSPVPMCGVPFRAAKNYIARLIAKGYKVAICDQLETFSLQNKGLVERGVVRVVTPGMIIEDDLLEGKTNNFILAAAGNENSMGISYMDISTATFRVTESQDLNALAAEIQRLSPSEMLLPASHTEKSFFRPLANAVPEKTITPLADTFFNSSHGRKRLLRQFKTLSLKGFGCEDLKAGIGAAGVLLHYVQETQKQPTSHLTRIETYSLDNYLLMDDLSCRNLELIDNLHTRTKQGTLLSVIDRTVTAMGGRLLKSWIRYPLRNSFQIEARLDAVAEAHADIRKAVAIREQLNRCMILNGLAAKSPWDMPTQESSGFESLFESGSKDSWHAGKLSNIPLSVARKGRQRYPGCK